MIAFDRIPRQNGRRPAPACPHQPPCPPADAPDAEAARIRATHPEQGWSLLCNGIVTFDDAGSLRPDGHATTRRPVAVLVPA